ncbi:MAG: 50S ribosomal protein L11 methyltransferase [Deferribacteraceae bacterium]|jgi:ribosomal protein L11 methyltransferase|nr:50S ribosomal protein L11 methyltransferase [Deferribacteraceae bacterium]
MQEYRLKSLPTPLKRELKLKGLEIIEEKFKHRKSWLVYSVERLEELLQGYGVSFEQQDVEATGWEERWKDYLRDGWLTDSVYYCFDDKIFDDDRAVIRINPALAFGTGSHATTQIAARLMEGVVAKQKVLDIGTGSAILAILASLKGAKSVYACDVDAVAINNARENVALNGCENVHLWAGEVTSISTALKPNVVVANIITSVLQPLHPFILTLHPKYIIYSGITEREGPDFIAALALKEYQPDDILHMDKWCGVRLKHVGL